MCKLHADLLAIDALPFNKYVCMYCCLLQGVRVAVDVTSALNLFPTARLCNNSAQEYAATRQLLQNIIAKMAALGSSDLLLSLHRTPENNMDPDQVWRFDRFPCSVGSFDLQNMLCSSMITGNQ